MQYLKLFLTIGLCSMFALSQAQVKIERQVIATTGNVSTAGNVNISATAGEAAPTYLVSGTFLLSQGFQQADLGAVSIDADEWAVDYKIYPNPTPDKLNVRFETDKSSTFYVQLTDLRGRPLPNLGEKIQGQGVLETTFSLESLPSAIYILNILDKEGQMMTSHKIRRQ